MQNPSYSGRLTKATDSVQYLKPRWVTSASDQDFLAALMARAASTTKPDVVVIRRRFGELVVQYRQEGQLSRNELARQSGLAKSYLTLIEQAKCNPPSRARTEKLAAGLKLSSYERRRLLLASVGLLDDYEPFLPVTTGDVEVELANLRMVWVVGKVPMEFQKGHRNAVYPTVLRAVSRGTTRFVYWIPQGVVSSFDALRERLEFDLGPEMPSSRLHSSLECIVCPEAICLHQFFLYNPLDRESRSARLGIPDKHGETIGAITMSPTYAEQMFSVLERAYDELRNQCEYTVDEHFKSDGAKLISRLTFLKYYPPQPKK
jgi:transcriptional regulator with XRE-family HTH domain